jgi:acetylornithine aminotransferase
LLLNAATVGEHLRSAFVRELQGLPGIKDIRGRGLMLGIELSVPCAELVTRSADNGLLISVTADRVIRLVPSLIMTTAEADEVVAILAPLIKQILIEKAPA